MFVPANDLMQWRSQGQLPLVGLDSGKIVVGSVVYTAELN